MDDPSAEIKIEPQVWDQGIPGQTTHVVPVRVLLKYKTTFPHQHQ